MANYEGFHLETQLLVLCGQWHCIKWQKPVEQKQQAGSEVTSALQSKANIFKRLCQTDNMPFFIIICTYNQCCLWCTDVTLHTSHQHSLIPLTMKPLGSHCIVLAQTCWFLLFIYFYYDFVLSCGNFVERHEKKLWSVTYSHCGKQHTRQMKSLQLKKVISCFPPSVKNNMWSWTTDWMEEWKYLLHHVTLAGNSRRRSGLRGCLMEQAEVYFYGLLQLSKSCFQWKKEWICAQM